MKEGLNPEFYNVVNAKIESDALGMIDDLHKARHAAETCGCHQCQHWFESMERVCEDEAWRITEQPTVDHEERWSRNQAVIKHTERQQHD